MSILIIYNYLRLSISIYVVCLVTKLSASSAPDPFVHFQDNNALIHSSKCCAIGEHLIHQNNSIKCSNIVFKSNKSNNVNHYQIWTTNITSQSYNFTENHDCNETNCVDFIQNENHWELVRYAHCQLESINKYNYIPKCCPSKFGYDAKTHKCVKITNENNELSPDDLQMMKIGLTECPVYDYAIEDFGVDVKSFTIDKATKNLRLQSGKSFNYGQYCIDHTTDNKLGYVIRACLQTRDVCADKRCLWKCCPDGQVYLQRNKAKKFCGPSINSEINLQAMSNEFIQHKEEDFAVISARLGDRQFKVREEFSFKINRNGDVDTVIDHINRHFESTEMVYCIEQFENETSTIQVLYMFYFELGNTAEIFKSIILFTSALFALLTILIYAILPEMQNVHGKCIMMECAFLFIGSAILCYSKVVPASPSWFCTFIAYGTIYAFLGLFAWLNIICTDMWMTFGVLRGFKVKDKKSELKKFLYYCLYGFGVPTVFVSFMVFAQQTDIFPDFMIPKIGNFKCFFDNDFSADYILYFLVPMSIMLIINVVLFIKTILYCIQVKNQIQRMRDGSINEKQRQKSKFNADKEKLIMLLKLFLIMGIPWMFEMISSFISFKTNWGLSVFETVIDTINCAKGIIIFCIFILKRNVLNLLAKKFGIKTAELRQSTELTSLTHTTNTN